MSAPIVLFTDFGYSNVYAGVLKGVILSIHPRAVIVDLSHGVAPCEILQASLELENAYNYFPAGTVFFCVVDPGVGTERKPLVVKTKKYYFVGPDNGIFSGVLGREKNVLIRHLNNSKFFLKQRVSQTFHGRDIFAPVAARLARGNPEKIFSSLGPEFSAIRRIHPPAVLKTKKGFKGEVIYFDHFGNAVTNICRSEFPGKSWGRAVISTGKARIGKIRAAYGAADSFPVALFNSGGRLEIAVPMGSAQTALALKRGTLVTVNFK